MFNVSCYTGCETGVCWICLGDPIVGSKVWVKEGDYFTVYFDLKNGAGVKATVRIKLVDVSGLGNCPSNKISPSEILTDIDAYGTYSDYFWVWPEGPCRLQIKVEVLDPDTNKYVETDSKCCFDVFTYEEFPYIYPSYMGSRELVEGEEHTLWVKVYKEGEWYSGVTVHHYIMRGDPYSSYTWEHVECKVSDEEGWAKFKWTPEKKAGEEEWHKFG